jgi:regulator of protease activity HflC (stomatin/prohibitin superfamily)
MLINLQIMDPYLASYSVEDPFYAVLQLAKIIMRVELGKLTLYETFEKEALNEKIVV